MHSPLASLKMQDVSFFSLFFLIFKIKRSWYLVHDTKKSELRNTLKGKKRQQTSGVAPLYGRLGTCKGQRQSSSLVPASLAQGEQL